MGAGRVKKSDVINPAVGIMLRHRIGDVILNGDTLATVYADKQEDIAFAQEEPAWRAHHPAGTGNAR